MTTYSTKVSTKLGTILVVWSAKGISEIRIPGSSSNNAPAPPENQDMPKWVENTCTKLRRHIEGDLQNFEDVPLDLSSAPEFHKKVYTRLLKLPPGQTVSYGKLADLLGAHGAARAVGRAMATNPLPFVVPCHRVIKSDGSLGEYSALEGQISKRKLLELEGCKFKNGRLAGK